MAYRPPLQIGKLSVHSDTDLGRPTEAEFAELLHQRAIDVGNAVYDPDAYEVLDLTPEERIQREIRYLSRRAFAEWFFGTVTPARQISLLPDDDVLLKLRLARQIADEVRHHDVFAAGVRRRRGEWRVQRYEPPTHLKSMLLAQVQGSSAAELAAANQYSGEVVLSVQDRDEGNVLRLVASDDIMDDIEDIEGDEPAHIAIGRDLVRRYAVDLDERRAMARSQEFFLEALIAQHVNELESLGLQRIGALPVFLAPGEGP